MKILAAAAVSALFAIVSGAASASIPVASDNFESGTGAITGQAGAQGWAGAWSSASAAATRPQVVNPAVAMEASNSLEFRSNNDNAAFRSLDATQSSDVIVEFMFQYSGILGTNDFLGLWLGTHQGPNIGIKANCGTGSCTNDVFVRTGGTGGSFVMNSDLQAGTNYHLFAHLYKSAPNANYNRFSLWLNPTAMEMSTLQGWDASFSGTSNINSFNTIGFRSANLDSGVSMRVDDLQVHNVPEPGSLALLGLALLGMAFIRRKM